MSPYITGDPVLMAHETSHHFALPHTHTGNDPYDIVQQTCTASANHDGDGIDDTPADPAGLERVTFTKFFFGGTTQQQTDWLNVTDALVPDADATTVPNFTAARVNPCHEWCSWDRFPVASPLNDAIPGLTTLLHAALLAQRCNGEAARRSAHPRRNGLPA